MVGRFYTQHAFLSGTTTLFIQGQGDLQAKRKLLDLLGKGNSVIDLTTDSQSEMNSQNGGEDDMSDETYESHNHVQNHLITPNQSDQSIMDEIKGLHTKINAFKADFDQLKNSLNATANQSNQPKENMLMKTTALLDENKSLKAEISKLEMEKQSLITALSLVNNELVQARLANNTSHATKPKPKGSSVEAPSNKKKENDQKYISRTIFVLGDSIVKDLKGPKMSKNDQVHVKPYSGSTTDDMQHFMRPWISKNPDEIILHVGTNDIKPSTDALELANKIISLGLEIKDRSEKTKVTISALVHRADNKKLNKKVTEVNNHLQTLSDDNDWVFIDHSNLNQDCFDNHSIV